MPDLTPSEWFDQFPPLEPGAPWREGQWCPRHWAPCPCLGANGIGAATELMQIFIDEMRVPALGSSPEAMNSQLDALGVLCCRLGDERMYEIWGHWPPAAPADAAEAD